MPGKEGQAHGLCCRHAEALPSDSDHRTGTGARTEAVPELCCKANSGRLWPSGFVGLKGWRSQTHPRSEYGYPRHLVRAGASKISAIPPFWTRLKSVTMASSHMQKHRGSTGPPPAAMTALMSCPMGSIGGHLLEELQKPVGSILMEVLN